jgi:carbon-monoxide dehydrogenase iron sulfur subunit
MKKVYINEEVCIGCRLCEVYCQLRHASSKDLIKAFKREAPKPLPGLRVEERGIVSLSVRCQHCQEAPCLYACLTGAVSRDPVSGVVAVDPAKCIGCWTCLMVCPFGAIVQDIAHKRVVRCDLCQGEEVPVCVANCPNEALSYIDTEDESRGAGGAVTSTLMGSEIN